MKIDIGSDGKILGTKRVSANGQISGFTEYAGAEVLVILPGGNGRPVVQKDAREVLKEAEQVVEERMRLAFQEYKALARRFGTPQQAAQEFFRSATPKTVRGMIERADQWLRQQAQALERRVESRLSLDERKSPKKKE